jgi:carboxyl-terminal processing protease
VRTPLCLACYFTLFFSTVVTAQTTLLQRKAALVQQAVAKNHITPRAVDDRFSADLFELFVNSIDAGALYLTRADLQPLQPYRLQLDDEWNGSAWKFLPAFTGLYKQKLHRADSLVQALCAMPFDFSTPEFYRPDTARCTDEKSWAARWKQLLKYEVLTYLLNASRNGTQPEPANKAALLKREVDARRLVQSKYRNHIKALLTPEPQFSEAAAVVYFNAYLGCMDAHSSYFDITAKQNFESGLNPDGYYFGFTLADEDDGTVVITHLEPGGPAWNSGVLNKGDVFLKLRWAGKETIALDGMSAMEISALLDQSNTDNLLLYVRKQNAAVDSVVLQKQKMSNDENIVKSFVLKGTQNIGYIMLPGFYSEWEAASGSHCAYDVAKEIVKLKQDNIAGLVLDLRFNGGGSLQEAIEMAGIFIDEGSVCQIRTREKTISLKDVNRGVIWSGPLLVLVNGQSASASELLAASLQDYNRAVIAGTPTYGKATGQQILPVEANNGSAVVNESTQSNGFVKLTTSRLYRNTGQAVQMQGVQPDIILPDAYQQFAQKEKDERHALPADTVSPYKYFKPLKPLPLSSLKQASSARISKSQASEKAVPGAWGNMVAGTLQVPLKWEDAVAEYAAVAKEYSRAAARQPTVLYTPVNNTADAVAFTRSGNRDERWIARLGTDRTIEEAYQIVLDLINQNK